MIPAQDPFPDRFGRLREAAGLTKTALAGERYTVSYVSQIESGGRYPSVEAVEYFAERLGVRPGYLVTGVPDDLEPELAYGLERAGRTLQRGNAEECTMLVRSMLDRTEAFGLSALRAKALLLMGRALVQLGRIREAIDRFEEALELDLANGDRGVATATLARAYASVGDLGYAAQLIESFMGEHGAAPIDPAVIVELHAVAVSVYFERGDMLRAERSAVRGLAAAEQGVSPQVRANILWSASRVMAEAKRWDEALELAAKARRLIEEQDDRRRLASIHTAYAFLCLEVDPPRTSEAARHLDAAEALLESDPPSTATAYLYAERSRLELLLHRPEAALIHVDRALVHVGDDHLERGKCLFLRGRALGELDHPEQAADTFHEAAATFQKSGARQQEAACWREIGEIQLRSGNPEAALEALRAGLSALDPARSRA